MSRDLLRETLAILEDAHKELNPWRRGELIGAAISRLTSALSAPDGGAQGWRVVDCTTGYEVRDADDRGLALFYHHHPYARQLALRMLAAAPSPPAPPEAETWPQIKPESEYKARSPRAVQDAVALVESDGRLDVLRDVCAAASAAPDFAPEQMLQCADDLDPQHVVTTASEITLHQAAAAMLRHAAGLTAEIERVRGDLLRHRTCSARHADTMSDTIEQLREDLAAAEQRATRAEGLETALKACRVRFSEYVIVHAGKGTPEGDAKADRNAEMVKLITAALSSESPDHG